MFPQTIGAVLAFLTLVAPGILFELRRERYQVTSATSAFREIAWIAFASVILTAMASSLLLISKLVLGDLIVDLPTWITEGLGYFKSHVYLTIGNVAAELTLACAMAWIGAKYLVGWGKKTGDLVKISLWYQAIREDTPKGTTPWVHVELTNGAAFYGYARGNSADAGSIDDREICLDGEYLSYRPPPGPDGTVATVTRIGDRWECAIISSPEIRFIKVQYLDDRTRDRVKSTRRLRALERDKAPATVVNDQEVIAQQPV